MAIINKRQIKTSGCVMSFCYASVNPPQRTALSRVVLIRPTSCRALIPRGFKSFRINLFCNSRMAHEVMESRHPSPRSLIPRHFLNKYS